MIESNIDFLAGYIFGLIVAYLLKKFVWDKNKKQWSKILKKHFKENDLMTSETYEKLHTE